MNLLASLLLATVVLLLCYACWAAGKAEGREDERRAWREFLDDLGRGTVVIEDHGRPEPQPPVEPSPEEIRS